MIMSQQQPQHRTTSTPNIFGKLWSDNTSFRDLCLDAHMHMFNFSFPIYSYIIVRVTFDFVDYSLVLFEVQFYVQLSYIIHFMECTIAFLIMVMMMRTYTKVFLSCHSLVSAKLASLKYTYFPTKLLMSNSILRLPNNQESPD